MTASLAKPTQNQLLASLPANITERLLPMLEPCPLPLGKCLYEIGETIEYCWFPLDAIVSLLYVTEDGDSTEIALIGNDGIVGIAPFLGGSSAISRAVVQSAGTAYRISTQAVMQEFDHTTELMTQILRYIQVLMTQMAQTAVCNRHHSVDQQLCRWLLMSLDRLPSDDLIMTQELIANMLGVRREGVNAAAGKLQKLGVIKYSRGRIRVLDYDKLQKLSCECYRVVKSETQRLYSANAALPNVPMNDVARLQKHRQ